MTRAMIPLFALLSACNGNFGSVVLEDDPNAEADADTDADSDSDTDADSDSDTDADSDSDTDSDTDADPEYMYPDWMSVTFYAGYADGELQAWSSSGTEYQPLVIMYLIAEEYQTTEDPYYLCALYWEAELSGADDDEAYAMARASYTPYWQSEGCDNLDPDIYSDDPLTEMGVDEGYVSFEEMTDTTRDTLNELTDNDFPGEDEDYYFAADLSFGDIDDVLGVYEDYYPGLQLFYAAGYAADDDLDTDFSEQLTAREVAAGTTGVLVGQSLSYSTEWF